MFEAKHVHEPITMAAVVLAATLTFRSFLFHERFLQRTSCDARKMLLHPPFIFCLSLIGYDEALTLVSVNPSECIMLRPLWYKISVDFYRGV